MKIDPGYVIEFQHSHIKAGERQARENFYKKMVWVVDGTRRMRDKGKFSDVLERSMSVDSKGAVRKLLGYFDECPLLRDWTDSHVPVFFDFGEDRLWCFLPKISQERYIVSIERQELITFLHPSSQVNNLEALLKDWNYFIIEMEKLSAIRQSYKPQYTNNSHYRPRRGQSGKRL